MTGGREQFNFSKNILPWDDKLTLIFNYNKLSIYTVLIKKLVIRQMDYFVLKYV